MARTFHCEVVSPDGSDFSDEIEFISLPVVGGEMGVMAHHEPVMAMLGIGTMRIKRAGESEPSLKLAVARGYAQVDNRGVTVLADRMVDVSLIDPKLCEERISELEKRETDMDEDERESIPGRDWVSSQLAWERYKLSLAQ